MPRAAIDTFARNRLPPPERMPGSVFSLPALQVPARLNCATELRTRLRQVLVCTSLATHKSYALPDDWRVGMQRFPSSA